MASPSPGGPAPRDSVPWAGAGRATSALVVQFSPCRSSVQLSLVPLPSLVHVLAAPRPCSTVPTQAGMAHRAGSCVAAMETECANGQMNQQMLAAEGPLHGFDYVISSLGDNRGFLSDNQSLSSSFSGTCWTIAPSNPVFPQVLQARLCPLVVPMWLLLRKCPAEELPHPSLVIPANGQWSACRDSVPFGGGRGGRGLPWGV